MRGATLLQRLPVSYGTFQSTHPVALPGKAEPARKDGKAAQNEERAALFAQRSVMRAPMQQLTLYGAQIFAPLRFEVNERPLAPAKRKVLQPRKLQKFFFGVRHSLRRRYIPSNICGSRPSSGSGMSMT